jgi:hypothetical protein
MKKKKEAKAQRVAPKQVINTSAKKETIDTPKQKNEPTSNDTAAVQPNNTPPVAEKQQVVNEQEQDQVVNMVEEITDVS